MTQATPPYTPPRSNGLGIAGFIVSLVAVLTCGILSPIGLLLSFFGLFRRPRGFAFAGFILGLFGTTLIVLVFSFFGLIIFQVVKFGKPMISTVVTMQQMRQKVDSYASTHAGALPDDFEGNAMIAGMPDGWGHTMHYRRIGNSGFEIRSAGQDGVFQTDDDGVQIFDKRFSP